MIVFPFWLLKFDSFIDIPDSVSFGIFGDDFICLFFGHSYTVILNRKNNLIFRTASRYRYYTSDSCIEVNSVVNGIFNQWLQNKIQSIVL